MLKIEKNPQLAEDYLLLIKKIILNEESVNIDEVLLTKEDYRKPYMDVYEVLKFAKIATIRELILIEPSKMDLSVQSMPQQKIMINIYNSLIKTEEFKKIILRMNVKSCPYCNRNHIEVILIESDNKKYRRTSQIDHFYSKSKTPLYAVSFYNLIPVCSTCNHKKLDEHFERNPYRLVESDLTFSLNILKLPYQMQDSIEIKLKGQVNDSLKLNLDILYQLHTNIVNEIIIKKRIYTPQVIELLSKNLGDLNYREKTIERLIFGHDSKDKLIDEPLSKLKHDILLLIDK